MVFPGQGSQSVGMQADLAAEFPVVQETYAEASEILGYDLWALIQGGPPEKLSETVVTQPAMTWPQAVAASRAVAANAANAVLKNVFIFGLLLLSQKRLTSAMGVFSPTGGSALKFVFP